MTITFIDKKDIPRVRELIAELYLELGDEEASITFLKDELIQDLLDSDKTQILKAVLPGVGIAGILTVTESQAIYSGGPYGSIDELYVLPEYRNRQLGKLLLDAVKAIASDRKWHRVDVTAPTRDYERTVSFYEQNGFEFTGPKLKFELFPI